MYRKALQLKKMINKSKVKGQTQTSQQADDNLPSELDVRFRIYQCHNILKNHREALAVVSELLSRETCLRLSYKGVWWDMKSGRSAIWHWIKIFIDEFGWCFQASWKEFVYPWSKLGEILLLGLPGVDLRRLKHMYKLKLCINKFITLCVSGSLMGENLLSVLFFCYLKVPYSWY